MVEAVQRERVRRARYYAPGVRPTRAYRFRGGGYRFRETGRNKRADRDERGLRNFSRSNLYYVLSCENDGENAERPQGGYGISRALPPYYLALPRKRRLTIKILGFRKPGRALETIYRQTVLHIQPRAIRRVLYQKTDLWGYFNIPSGTPRKQTEEERLRSARNNRILPEMPEGYEMPEGWSRQAARRSMTSSKFAEAFYRANK